MATNYAFGFKLFADHSKVTADPIGTSTKGFAKFTRGTADAYELKSERSFMDHIGTTDEIQRLTALVNAMDSGSPAGKFYLNRLTAIIGDPTGVKEDDIADSIYGRARTIYFGSYNDYANKGYKLKDAEALAFKLAKTQYDKDIDILNAEYPPDISGLVNKHFALSEVGKF